MMNLYEKIPRNSFVLEAVKTKDRASLEFQGHATKSDGATTYEMPYRASVSIIPHPDLLAAIDNLKKRLAYYFGYYGFNTAVNEARFGASVSQKKYITDTTEIILAEIRVTGMSFSGKERTSVIVKGTYNGSAINTKPLHFGNQEWGEELEVICGHIEDEVYAYIFEGKQAQLSLLDDEEYDKKKDGKSAAANDN
jgi:hypothetical protein